MWLLYACNVSCLGWGALSINYSLDFDDRAALDCKLPGGGFSYCILGIQGYFLECVRWSEMFAEWMNVN